MGIIGSNPSENDDVPASQPSAGGIQPDIMMWGPASAGKSSLLAAIMNILPSDRVFGADKGFLFEPDPTQSFTAKQTALNYQIAVVNRFVQTGVLSATSTDGEFDLNALKYTLPISLGRKLRFNMSDVAGEKIGKNNEAKTDITSQYWNYMRGAKGVLMTIDASAAFDEGVSGKKARGLYCNYIDTFIAGLDGHSLYAALCLTKIDMVLAEWGKQPEGNRLHDEQAKNILERILTSNRVSRLKRVFSAGPLQKSHLKLFMSSAVGWYQSGYRWVPNINSNAQYSEDETYLADADAWLPYQCAYPFLWLAENALRKPIEQIWSPATDKLRKACDRNTPYYV